MTFFFKIKALGCDRIPFDVPTRILSLLKQGLVFATAWWAHLSALVRLRLRQWTVNFARPSGSAMALLGSGGCCWETFCIFGYCGLVVELQPLNCHLFFAFLLPKPNVNQGQVAPFFFSSRGADQGELSSCAVERGKTLWMANVTR